MTEKSGSEDSRPRRYKPPAITKTPECSAAWDALVEAEGYPMQCTGVCAQGYFSAGWRAAMSALKKSPTAPPNKVPE